MSFSRSVAIAILVVLAVKMVVLWLLEWEDVSVSREFDDDRHGGGDRLGGLNVYRVYYTYYKPRIYKNLVFG